MKPLPRRRLARRLALLALALAVLAGLPWLSPAPMPVPEPVAAASAPSAAGPTAPAVPGLDDLRQTRERPLFQASRRPLGEPGGPAPEGFRARYRIAGVVIAPDRRLVLIGQGRDGPARSLAEGDSIGEWTILSITKDRIVVARGDQREDLPLGPENR